MAWRAIRYQNEHAAEGKVCKYVMWRGMRKEKTGFFVTFYSTYVQHYSGAMVILYTTNTGERNNV